MTIQEVINLIKKHSQDNYRDGSPMIPPHQHDGVDNLQVNPINFLGYPIFNVTDATVAPTDNVISGTIRFQYDGTNFTMWVMNETSWEQVGGGGGGTPGGSDTQVQFNDGGSFGGQSTFTFDKTDVVLTLDGGSGPGLSTITGGIGEIDIRTNDNSADNDVTAPILIYPGEQSGDNSSAGDTYLMGGNGTGTDTFGGKLILAAGSGEFGADGSVQILGNRKNVGAYSPGASSIYIKAEQDNSIVGDISLLTDSSGVNSSPTSIIINPGVDGGSQIGDVVITPGRADSKRGSVQVLTGRLLLGSPDNVSGNSHYIIMMEDTNTPNNPTNGGVLYVKAGALHFLGSSGTDTTIAPA